MSLEQKLYDLGAECVCGDLILNRTTVGRYRDGAFIPTPDAQEIVQKAAEAASGAVEEVVVQAAPARAARAPRTPKPSAPVVEEVKPEDPTPADSNEPPAADLLGDLDKLLGQ